MAGFKPGDAQQLREMIAWAAGEEQALEILGGASKRGLGRPLQTGHALDVSALRGIIARLGN